MESSDLGTTPKHALESRKFTCSDHVCVPPLPLRHSSFLWCMSLVHLRPSLEPCTFQSRSASPSLAAEGPETCKKFTQK